MKDKVGVVGNPLLSKYGKSALSDSEIRDAAEEELRALFAIKGREAFKKLESYNTEQSNLGRGHIFYIQDFAVIGVSERKARKKLRQILGTTLANPDINKKELEAAIVNIEKNGK